MFPCLIMFHKDKGKLTQNNSQPVVDESSLYMQFVGYLVVINAEVQYIVGRAVT
jgi:hypothetical protein